MSFPKTGNQMGSLGQIRKKVRFSASVGRFSIFSDLRSKNDKEDNANIDFKKKNTQTN